MKKILIIIILLPTLWFLIPKQTINSDSIDNIEDFVPILMEESAIPGLAIAKVNENGVQYSQVFGYANIDENKKVTKNTLFNIASVSKPIMGIALLQLIDQGVLALDQDINQYLPFKVDNPHLQNEVITLRHLVTHSSGIADYYDVNSYAVNTDSPITLEAHLKSFLTPTGKHFNNGQYYLQYKPGTHRKYSNLAAGLAGYIVEATTGMSLAQYSKLHLFNSLDMKETSWLLNDLSLEDIAIPYEVEQCIPFVFVCSNTEEPELNYVIGEYFNPPFNNKKYLAYPHFGNPQYPDGGVRTSINELGQFLYLLLNNKDKNGNELLSKAMYAEMLKLQLPAEVSDNQRFFWRDNSMGLTGHMGSDLGVFTALYFDPNKKEGFIIIMNRGMDSKAGNAMKKIAHKLFEL